MHRSATTERADNPLSSSGMVAKPKPKTAKPKTAKPKTAKPKTAKPKPKPKPAPVVSKVEHDELLAQYWQRPEPSTLRVWADSLIERGDPRGEYIQMCLLEAPTDEQIARREAFARKHRSRLAGPARPFLRELEFGANGLVERARCEADLLVAGLPLIEWLNPHLALSVTSVDAKGAGLAACSLERIYHVNFAWGVIGSQSGSNMKAATLVNIAPSLRRVRHLTLQCAGYADNCFSPAALQVLGETTECIEYLGLSYHSVADSEFADPRRPALAPITEYAKVIATAPGFRTLKVVFLRGLPDSGILSSLPDLVHVETLEDDAPGAWTNTSAYGADYGLPATAEEIEPLKTRAR